MDWTINIHAHCFFPPSSRCLLLTHSVFLSHSLCLCEVCTVSVCAHFQKKKKVTKFARALSFPLIWIQSSKVHVGSRLVSTAAQRANCVQQHHSVTRRLTNALAIVVFDRDTNAHAECPALLTSPPCDVAMGALSWWLLTCYDGGRCHGWFTCCFDPCCQSPVSSRRHSWLGWSR